MLYLVCVFLKGDLDLVDGFFHVCNLGKGSSARLLDRGAATLTAIFLLFLKASAVLLTLFCASVMPFFRFSMSAPIFTSRFAIVAKTAS